MSGGLAVFLEKHASLLQVAANLRRLYGPEQVPCDTTLLLRRLAASPGSDPISPVRFQRAFQQVLQRAQRGKVLGRMTGGVARPVSDGRGRYRHFFLPTGSTVRAACGSGIATARPRTPISSCVR